MGATILLVDDESAMRTAIRRVLLAHQLQVLEAADGPTAFEMWLGRRRGIDVILTDLLMPGMSGLQLMDEVRKHDPHARVVLMTGASEPLDQRVGAPSAVLQKPFSAQRLVEALGSLLPSHLVPL